MALPIIQPQTINYAQWDWNPGTTFLAAARTTASMLDNIKQAEQMDRKIALDEQIKTTLLPYEVADAQAKIDYTKAQTALAASRSRALADGAQTLSILDSMDGMTTEQLYDIAGLPVESSSAPSSPAAPAAKKQFNLNPGSTPSPTGGSFNSINVPADNPLQSFYSQDEGALYSIAARLPDGSSMSQLTDPKFALASAKDGMSTDAPARAEEMGVLQARANELDWDENPAVTETPAPAKAKPAWDSGVESELQGIRSQLGTNPLESLEVQRPGGPLIEAYASEADRPEGPSIGAYISKRYSDLQTAAQNAKNAKGNDRKVINAAAGALERRLYEDVAAKYDIDDPVVVQNLVKGPGGLRRTADEIESIYGIMRDRSVELPDKTGTPRQVAVTNWSEAFQAAELKRGSIKSSLEAATGGGVEEISKWQGVMEKTLDAEGNVMPDRMGEYEKAASEIDRLTGAPTGVSKFAGRYNSKQDRISKMTAAMDSGIPYKGLAVEQIPSEILKLNQETVELAVENAPYFGANDREAAAKWVTDPATKGLPFRSDYEGKKIPHFVTSELGVYNIWSPKEKTWMVVDKRKPKPETATAAEPTDNSQFSEAGKTGQKIRKAGGGLVRAVKGASTAVGEKISNIPAGAANAGASIVEAGAGVFNIPLKIPRASSISESLEKMGLKKYEDGTWGPSNK